LVSFLISAELAADRPASVQILNKTPAGCPALPLKVSFGAWIHLRARSDLPRQFNAILSVQPRLQKYSHSYQAQITGIS
jgi:hypothetical protein